MNQEVSASGMKVKAISGGSLVIAEQKDLLVPGYVTTAITASDATLHSLTPVTYDSGWKIVDPEFDVDEKTGSPDADLTDDFTLTAGTHYVDYIFYLASASTEDVLNQKLTATISLADGSSTELYTQAVSVAFYYNKTAATVTDEPTFILDIDGQKTDNVLSESCTILHTATGGAGTPVLCRVYVDGALASSSTAFVNSKNIPVEGVNVQVKFNVVTVA